MAEVRTPIGMALEADVLFARWNGSTYDEWVKLANSTQFSMTQNTDQQTLVGRDRSNFNNTAASLTTKEDTEVSFVCNMFDGLLMTYGTLGTESAQASGNVSISTTTNLAVSGTEAYLPHHNVSSVVITGSAITTDYTLDAANGIITIVSGGNLDGNTSIAVASYDYAQLVGSKIQMGTQTEIQGKVTVLATHRTNSKKFRLELGSVKIAPDGDYTFFNEDEFAELTLAGVAEIPSGQSYFGEIWWEA